MKSTTFFVGLTLLCLTIPGNNESLLQLFFPETMIILLFQNLSKYEEDRTNQICF